MARRVLIDRFGDVLLAAVGAAVFVAQIVVENRFAGERPQAIVVALLFSATLVWRRRRPLVPLLGGIGLIVCARGGGFTLRRVA